MWDLTVSDVSQKLLCEAEAPVHQHMGDQHQCAHWCRGGASSHAQGLPSYRMLTQPITASSTQINDVGISCGGHNRLAPVPLRRIRKLLRLYPFPCLKWEIWIMPTMPARSLRPPWGSFNMATLLKMREGKVKSGHTLRFSGFKIQSFYIPQHCLQVCD